MVPLGYPPRIPTPPHTPCALRRPSALGPRSSPSCCRLAFARACLGQAHGTAAMATAAECSTLSQMQCVFILALGRTGSTHLLRLLNSIPGYRISGETDNAWIHMGWFAHTLQLQAQAQARARGRRQSGGALSAADEGNLTLCAVRRLMLQVHNPRPHARCSESAAQVATPCGWRQIQRVASHGVSRDGVSRGGHAWICVLAPMEMTMWGHVCLAPCQRAQGP